MRFRSLITIAALVAVSAVVAIGYILIPTILRTNVSLLSLVLLAISVGLLVLSPLILQTKAKNGDAGNIASIGTRGSIIGATLGCALVTFLLALTGYDRGAWAMIVFTVAGYAVVSLALARVPELVDQAGERTSAPSQGIVWQAQVKALIAQVNDVEIAKSLGILEEKLRFAASGQSGSADSLSEEIGQSLNSLGRLLMDTECDSTTAQSAIRRVFSLIDQRNAVLGMVRSRA
jgi:hypothetical protein